MAESTPGGFWRVVGWSYAMSWGERVVMLATTFALARWIGPSEFGTFAIASVLVLFLQIFLDQGVATAIVQRRKLANDQLNGAFWLMAGGSVALALLGLVLAPLWADFNDLPALTPVIALFLLALPIQGLTVIQRALLQRDLDFRSLAGFTVMSSAAGAATGLAMALAGAGVFALVAQHLIAEVVRSLLIWRASSWRPARPAASAKDTKLLRYAYRVSIAAIGRFIHRRSDVAVIGYFFGPTPAGLYFLADRLVNTLTETFTRPISVASMPRFSQVQNNPAALRRAYLGCVRASTFVTLPAMAMLVVVAEPGLTILGPSWQGIATAASILCVLGAARSITLLTGPMLFALARPGTMARLTWLHAAISVPAVLVAAMLLRGAEPFAQISGVAIVRALVFALLFTPISVGLALRACAVSLRETLRQIRAPFLASAAVLIVGVTVLETGERLSLGALTTFFLVSSTSAVAAAGVLASIDTELRTRVRHFIHDGQLETLIGANEDEQIGGG